MTSEKVHEVIELLERLKSRLGAEAFVVQDHWESDAAAIGIASPQDERVLVYIRANLARSERYSVELELPPNLGDDFPYRVAGSADDVGFVELAEIVANHLGRI